MGSESCSTPEGSDMLSAAECELLNFSKDGQTALTCLPENYEESEWPNSITRPAWIHADCSHVPIQRTLDQSLVSHNGLTRPELIFDARRGIPKNAGHLISVSFAQAWRTWRGRRWTSWTRSWRWRSRSTRRRWSTSWHCETSSSMRKSWRTSSSRCCCPSRRSDARLSWTRSAAGAWLPRWVGRGSIQNDCVARDHQNRALWVTHPGPVLPACFSVYWMAIWLWHKQDPQILICLQEKRGSYSITNDWYSYEGRAMCGIDMRVEFEPSSAEDNLKSTIPNCSSFYSIISNLVSVFDHSHPIPRKPGSSNHWSTSDLHKK